MDFSKLTELEKGFRPLCCDKGIGLECCTDKCAADEEQSELTAERAAKAQGALTDERAAFELVEQNNSTNLTRQNDGQYENPCTQSAWEGWQARAALAPSIQALPVVAPSDASLITEARAVFDLMLEGCTYTAFNDWQNGHGETIGPRVDALHARLRAYPAAAQPEAKEAPAALSDDDLDKLWSDVLTTLPMPKPAYLKFARRVLAAAGNSQDAKDAVRLDFLDTNAKWNTGWCVKKASSGAISVRSVIESSGVTSIRQAIDAAMAAAPSPAKD